MFYLIADRYEEKLIGLATVTFNLIFNVRIIVFFIVKW